MLPPGIKDMGEKIIQPFNTVLEGESKVKSWSGSQFFKRQWS
jgi:hypothetical protein